MLHAECLSHDKVMVVRLAGGRELLMAAAWTLAGNAAGKEGMCQSMGGPGGVGATMTTTHAPPHALNMHPVALLGPPPPPSHARLGLAGSVGSKLKPPLAS